MVWKARTTIPFQMENVSEMVSLERSTMDRYNEGYNKWGVLCVNPPPGYDCWGGSNYFEFEKLKKNEKVKYVEIKRTEMPGIPGLFSVEEVGKGTDSLINFRTEFEEKPILTEDQFWEEKIMTTKYIEAVVGSYQENQGEPCWDHRTAKGINQGERFWDLRTTNGILKLLPKKLYQWDGIRNSMIYSAAPGAPFVGQTENMEFGSLAHHAYGKTKTWYSCSDDDYLTYYDVLGRVLPDLQRECPGFIHHKGILATPNYMIEHGCQMYRTDQNLNDFLLTFPAAHHCGYNQGFNLASSTNYGDPLWLPRFRHRIDCICWDVINPVTLEVTKKAGHPPYLENDIFAKTFMSLYEPKLFKDVEANGFKNLKLDDSPFPASRYALIEFTCRCCKHHFKSKKSLDAHVKGMENKFCPWCHIPRDYSNRDRHLKRDCDPFKERNKKIRDVIDNVAKNETEENNALD